MSESHKEYKVLEGSDLLENDKRYQLLVQEASERHDEIKQYYESEFYREVKKWQKQYEENENNERNFDYTSKSFHQINVYIKAKKEAAENLKRLLPFVEDHTAWVKSQETEHEALKLALEKMRAECKQYEEKKKAKAAAKKISDAVNSNLKITEFAGASTFVGGIFLDVLNYIAAAISKALSFPVSTAVAPSSISMFGVVGGPVAMASIALQTIREVGQAIFNSAVTQRKTKIGAGLATLGLIGVALAVTFSAFVAAPFATPVIFLTMLVVGAVKAEMIRTQLLENAKILQKKITAKNAELDSAVDDAVASHLRNAPNEALKISYQAANDREAKKAIIVREPSLFAALKKDPKLLRMTREKMHLQFQKEKLEMSARHIKESRWGTAAAIFGVLCIIVGVAFPIVLPLAFVGGAILVGSIANGISDAGRQAKEMEKLQKAQQERELNIESEVEKTILSAQRKTVGRPVVLGMGADFEAAPRHATSPKGHDVKSHSVGMGNPANTAVVGSSVQTAHSSEASVIATLSTAPALPPGAAQGANSSAASHGHVAQPLLGVVPSDSNAPIPAAGAFTSLAASITDASAIQANATSSPSEFHYGQPGDPTLHAHHPQTGGAYSAAPAPEAQPAAADVRPASPKKH